MQIFIRNVIGIALLVGLSFTVGCVSTSPGGRTSTPANGFPWSKTEKAPEKAGSESLSQALARDRVTSW